MIVFDKEMLVKTMNEPIRILQVVTKMDRAGLETMLMNYYRHIDHNKIQFDFLTHRQERGDYDHEIESLGGRIYHTYPIHPKYMVQYQKWLKLFFVEHSEYRIIHSHIDALSFYPLYAAKKAGIPVRISHSHNCDFDKDMKLPFRIFSKHLIPMVATDFWGCSKPAIEFMFGKKIASYNNHVVLQNAINAKKFIYNLPLREQMRKSLHIEDKLVIGHIGRFMYQKNHSFLIEIFEEIHKQEPKSVLILIGRGKEQEKINRLVFEKGLVDSVIFLGVRSDIPELMQAMDVFLLPSRFEGLPVVLIEAQAAGLSCVVSKDVIRDEVNISGLVTFVSLDQSGEVWANAVMTCNKVRQNMLMCLQDNGYDVEQQAQWLVDKYIRLFGEIR